MANTDSLVLKSISSGELDDSRKATVKTALNCLLQNERALKDLQSFRARCKKLGNKMRRLEKD